MQEAHGRQRHHLSEQAGDRAPGRTVPARRRWLRPRRSLAAAWLIGVLAAFAVYLRLARTRAVNSDGAGNALQAWDMLRGNLLLHGWSLTDVSFYTTELPQYMLVELARGLNQDVVHVAAAMTYTLAVLLAALLAKGSSKGPEAMMRVVIAAGIMLAPQLASGVNILISSPDHVGTSVAVMAIWLILDRARPRWYLPVIVAALLTWAQVADTLVLYIGALPLVVVSAVRAYQAAAFQRQRLASQWYDISLAAAGLAGAAGAPLALYVIHSHGGFLSPSPVTQFVQSGVLLPRHLGITAEGLLLLGGADFLGLRLTGSAVFTVLHVAGVAVAARGTWLAGRRFLRDRDRVAQVLVTAVIINLAAYVLSTQCKGIASTREIAAVLPFSAALAGRTLARRFVPPRLMPLLLAVLAGYLAGLVGEIVHPPVPAQNEQLTSWLAAHHLRTGLSGYWEANVVTVTSGERVRIRVVRPVGGLLAPGAAGVKAAWYDPARSSADFVVLFQGVAGYPGFTDRRAVLATFGPPARTYHAGPYTVLVWNRNLLSDLR